MKKSFLFFLTLLILALPFWAWSAIAEAIPKDILGEIFIIGVMEPSNKTEIPGHIDFPYLPEKLEQLLTDARYKVIPINRQMLEDAGIYLYSSIAPDKSLAPNDIMHLAKKYKFDALMTGNIYTLQTKTESDIFTVKRFYNLNIEGVLYYGKDGSELWKGSIQKYEKIKPTSESSDTEKQKLDINIDASQKIGDALIQVIGTKPKDNEPPIIEISTSKKHNCPPAWQGVR